MGATDTLEYTNVAYVTKTKCQNQLNSYFLGKYGKSNWTNETIGDTMMCALGDNTDSCQGDSGGPLIKTGTTTQVGVTSWGIGCNRGVPSAYASVAVFADWIQTQISSYQSGDSTSSSGGSSTGDSGSTGSTGDSGSTGSNNPSVTSGYSNTDATDATEATDS